MNSHGDFSDQSARVANREGPLLVKIAKASLWVASWGVSIWWISLWFRLPNAEGKAFKRHVSTAVASSFWGRYCKHLKSEFHSGIIRSSNSKLKHDCLLTSDDAMSFLIDPLRSDVHDLCSYELRVVRSASDCLGYLSLVVLGARGKIPDEVE